MVNRRREAVVLGCVVVSALFLAAIVVQPQSGALGALQTRVVLEDSHLLRQFEDRKVRVCMCVWVCFL
jgi:hypothetical protein